MVTCVLTKDSRDSTGGAESANGPPFEGPEKLLELWFAPSADQVPIASNVGTRAGLLPSGPKFTGLRTVSHPLWHAMLDQVKCKVLSVIESEQVDAFLLSESSMFVWPHKIILKTCGTTGLLLGLDSLLKIARDQCGFSGAWRWFYSRKAFMFPAQQSAPHTSWEDETRFLDHRFGPSSFPFFLSSFFFPASSHSTDNQSTLILEIYWMIILRSAPHATAQVLGENPWYLYHRTAPPRSGSAAPPNAILPNSDVNAMNGTSQQAIEPEQVAHLAERDYTLEILMTGLSRRAASHFETSEELGEGHDAGIQIATSLGIDAPGLLGRGETDAYLFSPCGFSANLVGGPDQKRYGTIHVTPERSHSFASFESNVDYTNRHLELRNVISRILKTFEPKNTTITLFNSHAEEPPINQASHSDLDQKLDQLLDLDLRNLYRLGEQKDHELDDYNLAYISLQRREEESDSTLPAGP
ncbi:spermidine resistance protein [Puccinia graminis f. sp. tritici]|uniref:Spermidine resistance protein n=1 Tax=Puccinia graminis f. sp. tritici TaxID=56615 RepID=A0A5B0P648_PUCGR|nr:spermidine resistance protein [Puccinia graminis f. sp. tritici]